MKMSPEKKIEMAMRLYWDARALKRAALKQDFPDLSDEEIDKKVRDIFLRART
jgi:hypothetical protein